MTSIRNFVAVLLLVIAVLAIVLPLPDSDKGHLLTEQEASDSTLVIYSDRDPDLIEPLIAQFQADTGVETRLVTATAEETIQETGGLIPDVYLSKNASAMNTLSEANLLDTLPAYLASGIDEQFVHEQWAGVSARVQVVAYNPDKISPENLPDDLPIFESDKEALEKLLSGEIDAALAYQDAILRILAENPSARLAIHYPHDKIAVSVSGVAIFAKSDSKPLAQQFISYLYFPAGQTYFRDNLYEYPLMAGIETDEMPVPLREILDMIGEKQE